MKDNDFLSKCYDLAAIGKGYVSPNPLVGAVIVENGKIISEGYHSKHGEIHAEVDALNKISDKKLTDATLYCTLEPCSHNSISKVNPPCTDAIIESGIKKVVIGMLDPNPEVNGRGLKKLVKHGIDVIVSDQAELFAEQNRFFIKNMKQEQPFITLKLATSIDGKISDSLGNSKWITSERLRKIVHEYRHEHDAVLIGSGTAEKDNPELTVRHIEGVQPWRIIIDTNLKLNKNLKLFTDDYKSKTIVICSNDVEQSRVMDLNENGVNVICLDKKNNHIPLKSILSALYKKKIKSVLVEAGPTLATNFINQNCVDELILMISNKIIGIGQSGFLGLNVTDINNAPTINIKSVDRVENELIVKGNILCSQA